MFLVSLLFAFISDTRREPRASHPRLQCPELQSKAPRHEAFPVSLSRLSPRLLAAGEQFFSSIVRSTCESPAKSSCSISYQKPYRLPQPSPSLRTTCPSLLFSCPCLGAWPHNAVMRCNDERATRPLGNTMVNNANSAFLSDWACADLRWPSAWPQSQLRISGETALSAPPTAGRIGCARGNRECAVPTTLIENYVTSYSRVAVRLGPRSTFSPGAA